MVRRTSWRGDREGTGARLLGRDPRGRRRTGRPGSRVRWNSRRRNGRPRQGARRLRRHCRGRSGVRAPEASSIPAASASPPTSSPSRRSSNRPVRSNSPSIKRRSCHRPRPLRNQSRRRRTRGRAGAGAADTGAAGKPAIRLRGRRTGTGPRQQRRRVRRPVSGRRRGQLRRRGWVRVREVNRTTRFGRVRLVLGCAFVALLVSCFRSECGGRATTWLAIAEFRPGTQKPRTHNRSRTQSVFPRTTDCSGAPAGFDGLRIKSGGGGVRGYAYGAFGWTAPPGTSSRTSTSTSTSEVTTATAPRSPSRARGALLGRWGPPPSRPMARGGSERRCRRVPSSLPPGSNALGGCAASGTGTHVCQEPLLHDRRRDLTPPRLVGRLAARGWHPPGDREPDRDGLG